MRRIAYSFVGLLVCWVATARAAEHRIALVQGDPELSRAVALALAPWGVEAIASDAPTPGGSLPEAAERAVELTRQLDVDAVAWVSVPDRGSVLWVFDARTDEISTRVLAESPPFTSPVAAAVALSLKTVLRATVVAPEAERFGATPGAPPAKAERLAFEAGARVHFLAAHKAETLVSLGAVAWFPAFSRIGAALTFSAGPGVAIESNGYAGRYREFAVAASARWRFASTDWMSAALALGATGHFTELDGSLVELHAPIAVRRFNASVDLGARFNVKLASGVYVGLDADVSYLGMFQRYLVDGRPVFAMSPFATLVGGHVGVDLF
ncbi:MAG TPA: hypothetical protein VJT73_00475 [Polyangiaceae bacterium]|nr:hypothetical protein [Polyangiaceae bacterium]